MLELSAEKLKLKVQKLQNKESEFVILQILHVRYYNKSAFWISSFFLKKKKNI